MLYALVAEKLLAGEVVISGGRLYYCTSTGRFTERTVALDGRARDAAALVAETVDAAIAEPFLPAAPDKRQCEFCDFRIVCGPHEQRRTALKPAGRLKRLNGLRDMS